MSFRGAGAALVWLTACGAPEVTDLAVAHFPIGTMDLGTVGPAETQFPWTEFTLLNEGTLDLTVVHARLGGLSVALLEEDEPADTEDPLLPRDAWTMGVRIAPPPGNDARLWSTQEIEGTLTVLVEGYAGTDLTTGEPDPDTLLQTEIVVGLTGLIDCDHDNDGFDDEACGGSDCDDLAPGVNPATPEACDLIDNNCDGVVDGLACLNK